MILRYLLKASLLKNLKSLLTISLFLNKTTPVLYIFLNSSIIVVTNSVKDLGVIIDNNLIFEKH